MSKKSQKSWFNPAEYIFKIQPAFASDTMYFFSDIETAIVATNLAQDKFELELASYRFVLCRCRWRWRHTALSAPESRFSRLRGRKPVGRLKCRYCNCTHLAYLINCDAETIATGN